MAHTQQKKHRSKTSCCAVSCFVSFRGVQRYVWMQKSIFWYVSFNSKTTKHQVSSNTRRKGSPKKDKNNTQHTRHEKQENKKKPHQKLFTHKV